MSKCVLVINPSAGHELGRKVAAPLKAVLLQNFDEVDTKYTEKAGDATRFVAEAVAANASAYFVVGGDGTVNEAINGLAEYSEPLPFGFLPLGTVNDLARALKIPLDPEKAITAYKHFTHKKIDIGKINDAYFMNVAAIGSVPEAVTHTSVKDKSRFGIFAYVRDGLQALIKSENQQYTVVVDGEKSIIETNLIIVALTNSVAGLENMFGDAKVDDGKLHFMALKPEIVLQKSGQLMRKMFQGDISKAEIIDYKSAVTIEISQANHISKKIETNVDGDPGPELPVKIEVLPQRITVMLPDSL